jgi:ABC-type Co2+ transport system permease subunit
MTIVNRRNAVVGWTVWKAAKYIGKQKARAAVPGTGGYAGLNKSAIVTIAAVAAGTALVLFRKKSAEPAT